MACARNTAARKGTVQLLNLVINGYAENQQLEEYPTGTRASTLGKYDFRFQFAFLCICMALVCEASLGG